MIIEFGS